MGSVKSPEQPALRQYRQNSDQKKLVVAYNNMPANLKTQLVQQLFSEQRGLCVYCGQAIDLTKSRTFHVEHFKPKNEADGYPNEALTHTNLYISCGPETATGHSQWCGHVKGNWFDIGLSISPNHPDCTERFVFTTRGKIRPTDPNDIAAVEMIERLGLAHSELERERRELIKSLDNPETPITPWKDRAQRHAISYGHVVARREGKNLT